MEALKSKERTVSLFVFGCGLALGLTGLYTYYRSKKIVAKEMRSLSLVVENLKQEVDELKRSSQSHSPLNLLLPTSGKGPSRTRYHDEADAASDIASGDEEFYDFAET